ncbi:DNRLRE domain-containing protein [Streptomyces sp. NPDC058691]|uniref:DNRLRE domain-containing protein n=1 Tax=Streptomyces sp. NPDC058691 TaxID=3346601 RepID=UPI0036529CC2
MAQLQNRRIEVLAQRAADSSTFVNPDGSLTTEAYAGPVRVKQSDGSWKDIDTSLADVGDHLQPQVSVADVAVSDGGDKALASVTAGSKTFGLDWGSMLPSPTIDGDTASYDLGGGASLTVQALAQGFEQSVVLDRAPTAPVSYRIPVTLKGLSLSKDSDSGHLLLKDTSGKLVAEAAAPHLWDSSKDAVSGEPEHQAQVDTSIETADDGSTTLVLTPDPAFFAQDLTYPVTIDPSSTLAVTTDTWVQTPDFLDSQIGSQDLKSGTFDSGGHIARSYLKFDVSPFKGKHILSATMSLYSYFSSTCATAGPATLAKRIITDWDSHTVTWGAQPGTTTNSEASNTGHWGFDASCPENWSNWNLTSMVQDWAGGIVNDGIQLRSADESDLTTWRRFRSANYTTAGFAPKMVVNYNSKPGTPALVSPVNGAATSDTTPMLQAKSTDADGNKVTLAFEVWNSAGTTRVTSGAAAAATSGTTVSWTSPALAPGAYKWRAQASDGTDTSAWSAWNTLTVDTTAPGNTAVSSTDFPANTWAGTGDGNGNFSGAFTFTPPTSDVTSVQYQLDGGSWVTAATTGGAVTRTLTFTDGKHTLAAKTKDAAGNTSAVTSYVFFAGDGASLTTPGEGERPARRVGLSALGQGTYTAVTYQYRTGETDTWHTLPTGDVTKNSDGSTLNAWPVPVTNGVPAPLTWNITSTLPDGPVDVRAEFTDGTSEFNSLPHTVTVDRNAGTAPSLDAGPASVNALTGDATLSATDASAFGMAVARTASSRRPGNGAAQAGQAAIFGPQWTAGTTAEITDSDWAYLGKTSNTSVALVDVDGDPTGFTATTAKGWKPEPGAEDLTLTSIDSTGNASTDLTKIASFTLKDTDGTTTTFTKPSGASTWQVSTTFLPTSNSTTTVVPDAVQTGGLIRPKYVIAPTSAVAAATCQSTPSTKGCRMLEYLYATSTTATSTAFGDFFGQVKQIRLWATTPGDSTATASVIAQYAYDEAGRLREEFDPRTTPALKTTYSYDAAGRITTETDPGQLPWTFTYTKVGTSPVAGDGMLVSVSRPTLRQGSNTQTDGGTAATNVVYQVPLSGSNAPQQMESTDVDDWGQTDTPADATAVFPADQVPASHDGTQLGSGAYGRATLTYTDASGREVNTATPGGHITTTQYDQFGNTVQELNAANRELALGTAGWQQDQQRQLDILGDTPVVRAQKLSTISVYSTDGQRQLEEFGPLHQVTLAAALTAAPGGTDLDPGSVKPAREHTVNSYDEGRPTDGTATVSDQVTTTRVGAFIDGYPNDGDVRTTTTAYDWVKGLATKTVTDPGTGHLSIAQTTGYDAQGRVISAGMPKSTGSDAGTTVTTYWSATGTGACAGKPEWADLVCSTGPAAAITGGGTNPSQLLTKTTTYDRWGNPSAVTETANGTTRTTTTTYDTAGRPLSVKVTGGVGTAVPDVTTTYDPATGEKATVTSSAGTVSYTYDALGRQTRYTDGSGNTATTAYDALDRPVTVTDSAPSTTSYAYDPAKDPRGLATSITDSVAGTTSAEYDANGDMFAEHLPGGVSLTIARDQTSAVTGRFYSLDADGTQIAADAGMDTVQGQQATHTSTTGTSADQAYTYDAAGRLTQVDDTQAGTTTHRAYAFDDNTNRTGLTTTVDNPDGTPGTPTATAYTYDSADRLQTAGGTGVAYDAFGRTTTQADGTTLAYYTNDLARQETAGSQRTTWTLDASGRLAAWTTDTNTAGTWATTSSKTNHYGSDTDSPDWTAEDTAGTITRNVQGIDGDLVATTTAIGSTVLQLTNMHGDAVVQYPLDTTQNPTVQAYDEYGNPINSTAATRYGWLGGKQRSTDTPSGLTLMGVRLYNPTTGRFLSTDPVPGGSANAYEYCNADPINHYDLDGRFWGHRTFWNSVGFFSYRSWIDAGGAAGHGHYRKAWHYASGGTGSVTAGAAHSKFCSWWCRTVKHARPSAWSRFGKIGARTFGWEVSVGATALDYWHTRGPVTSYRRTYWAPGYRYNHGYHRTM